MLIKKLIKNKLIKEININ